MAPGGEVAQAQRAEGHAAQVDHAVADRLAHPPYLALAALVDRQLELVRAEQAHVGRRGAAVLELDALAQRAQGALARAPLDPRPIGPRHLEARMGERVGEVAVVGEQDQARAVGVQAADRVQALARRDEVDHGAPPVRVGRRGHHAGRLVQRVDDARARARATSSPSTAIASSPVTPRAGSVTTAPSTVTRPSTTSASDARREATPA